MALASVPSLPRNWADQPPEAPASAVNNGGPGPGPNQPPSSFAEELLRLTNAYRQQNGLRALSLDGRLNAAAQAHSNDMARNRFMDHRGSDGSDFSQRIARTGYSAGLRAENVAKGFNSAQAVFQGWVNSDGHRRNILLNGVIHMGGACAQSDAVYCTQVFAVPL